MADEHTSGRKPREDETGELSIGDLDDFDPPTGEISLDDLEMVKAAPPPPAPAKAKSRAKPPKPKRPAKTRRGVPDAEEPPTAKRTMPPPPPPRGGTPATGQPVTAAPRPPAQPAARPKAPPPAAPVVSSPVVSSPPRPSVSSPPPAPRASVSAPPPPRDSAPPAGPEPMAAPAIPHAEPPEVTEHDASSEELRDLLAGQVEAEKDPERKGRLNYELGRLYEVDLDDPARAAEHYQNVLRTSSDHAAAIRGARRTLAKLKRHGALPNLFDAEVELTRDPKERARLLYAKARVMEEHLRQAGPALKVYEQALELDPGNLAVLKAMERSYRRDKAWQPLAKTYEQLANAVEDSALRAAWTAMRARLIETRLDNPTQAAALYEAAVEADAFATASLANVKRLGAAQKRWPQLVGALLEEQRLTKDEATRREIYAIVARIQELRLGDDEAAVRTLDAGLTAHPHDPLFLSELVRIHRANGRHGPEVEALVSLVEVVEHPAEKARMAARIAHVYEQLLGDSDRAKPWYQRALSFDPTHRTAALSLARLHLKHQGYAEAIAVWAARAEAIPSATERADLHVQIGRLYEQHLDDAQKAAEHHQKALGLDPDQPEAFQALSRLLAAASSWRELVELYERAVDRASNPEIATAWLFRVGAILEDRLDDSTGALSTYRRILEKHPSHLGALHAAQRAAARAADYHAAVDLVEQEAKLTQDKTRASGLRHQAAMWIAEELGDPTTAAQSLENLLKQDPEHAASLESLARLYSNAGRWSDVIRIERRRLRHAANDEDRVRLLFRIAEIEEAELGHPKEAVKAYQETLELDPGFEPAREALLAALERTESHRELQVALEEKAGRITDPHEKARLLTRVGGLLEDRLNKPDEALERYDAALALVPLHRPALDARERLLTERQDWKRLTDVLQEEAGEMTDPFLKTQASLRAAQIMSEEQGAVVPALEAFRPVFAERPDHIGALLSVEEIYARTRDDAGLAATFEKMAQVVEDPRAKLAALQELARARAATGGETTSVQRKILRLAPDDPSALEALAEHATLSGEREVQLAMQARLASTASDPTVASFHQSRVGELLLADSEPAGALAAFRAALGHDPHSLTAIRGLSRAARLAKDPNALREAAQHEARSTRDNRVALSLLLEAASLRQARQDLKGAGEDYTLALAHDPGSPEAAQGLRSVLADLGDVPKAIEVLGRAANETKDPSRAGALHLSVAELHAEARLDVPAAIAAAERALAAQKDDPDALAQLAVYYERAGQWDQALSALDRLIPRAKNEALVEAHMRLARIAEHRTKNAERAIRSLRAVLARDEDHEDALIALSRLEREAGRDEEALRLVKKLIDIVSDRTRRAAALAELAQLEVGRGQPADAAKAALSAIAIQGPGSTSARVYQGLIKTHGQIASWDQYAQGITAFLEHQKADGGEVATAYKELARVFQEGHNRPDRAVAILREGVAACPSDPLISMALVTSLGELGAHDKALDELRRVLTYDVRNPRAFRAMANVVRALREPDGAAVTLAPLVAMREATDDEKRIVASRKPKVARAHPGILSETGLEQIVDRQALAATASNLLRAMADVFAKIEGIDYEAWGVVKRDRIRHGDTHHLRTYADKIGMIYGVPEYDLFITASPNVTRPTVVSGSPPALLVPSSMETVKDPVMAYHLARPLALLSRHLHPLDHLETAALARILVAAARLQEPGFTLGQPDAELDDEAKRVSKAIGFFNRGKLHDTATSFAAAPTPDLPSWARDLRFMAHRAALLVCDDLLHALEANGGSLGRDPVADDLVRFWVSDPATRFRRVMVDTV